MYFKNVTKKIKIFIKYSEFFLILALSLCLLGFTSGLSNAQITTYQNQDTIKLDILQANNTIQLLDTVENDSPKNTLESKIDYTAKDSIVILLKDNKIKLYNSSVVNYTTMKVSANYIELDSKNSLIYAKGSIDTAGKEVGIPIFVDKANKYTSNTLKYNYLTEKGYIEKVFTKEEEGYIHGQKTKRVDKNTFYLYKGKYTTCDIKEHPHYYLQLNKAKMIKDKAVFAKGFGLTIEETTLLYLPFPVYFPFRKKYSSGFIMPSYGEEERRGFFFRNIGLYFAASDYFDILLQGDIFSNGSWGTSFRSNYRKRYKFSGALDTRFYSNKLGDKDLENYSEKKDFSIRWTHQQDRKAHPYRTFSASVDFSTSSYDYNNARHLSNIVNNKKQSSISLSQRWPNSPLSLNATIRHSQNSIDTTINLSLPDISFNMTTIYPFRSKNRIGKLKWFDKISLNYSAQLRNSINIHEDKLFDTNILKDWRNGFQHRLPISTNFKLARDLTVSASASYNGVLYTNSIRKTWDTASNRVVLDTLQGVNYGHSLNASSSLSFTPKIYGIFQFGEDAKIKALRHVISPSINISYTPKIDIAKNKYYKTYNITTTNQEVEYSIFERGIFGTPRGGREYANINFSIDNNLEMKVAQADTAEIKKVKILESLRLSGSYNLLIDSMKLSLLSLSGRTSIFKNKVRISFSGNIDPYAIDESGRRYNKFEGLFGRLTSFSISLGTQFNSKSSKKNSTLSNVETLDDYSHYVDFDIPWNIGLNYNFRYTKPTFKSTTTQYLRINGGFNLTPKWKVTFSSGFDFDKKEVTSSQFSVHRDLHCWEMSFSAIPFGYHRSYTFQINVKSSLLKDLKLDKHESWYDN